MSNYTFSVIMPVWNRAEVATRAIESVLSQTFRDYELLVIDDGSEDDLEAVIRPYVSERLVYRRIPHRGISAARNVGLQHAAGTFIAHLDSDNVWHPEFLSTILRALTHSVPRRETAYCKYNVYKKDEVNGAVHLDRVAGEDFNFRKLLLGNYIDINSFVHARKCLEYTDLFDEGLKRLEDWDFVLRLVAKYEPVFVPKILVDYYHGTEQNAITLTENLEVADQAVRQKSVKYREPITVEHDTFTYTWRNVPDEKYYNWVKMTNNEFNTSDFTAWGLPYMLQIEVTSLCNLSCTACPQGRKLLGRAYRHMTLKEFQSIIDDMESYLLFLVLWNWGEPLMNPEFPSMVKYASERGIKTVTSTNGHFLNDREYVKKLLESGLTTLIVAIDSLRDNRYTTFRRSGDLGRAISGLENVLALKRELGSETLINWRMVVMKQNEREVRKMKRMARKLKVDRFTVKTLNPDSGMGRIDHGIIPDNPRYRRHSYRKGTYEPIQTGAPCATIWQMSNVLSNGDVVPCCWDYSSEMKVGNIHETPLSKIWNSPAYRELRKRIYCHKDSIPKCRNCTMSLELTAGGWFPEYHDFNVEGRRTRFFRKLRTYV